MRETNLAGRRVDGSVDIHFYNARARELRAQALKSLIAYLVHSVVRLTTIRHDAVAKLG